MCGSVKCYADEYCCESANRCDDEPYKQYCIDACAGICDCIDWKPQGCGMLNCENNEMRYTRTCNPSGCDNYSDCVEDESCVTIVEEEVDVGTGEDVGEDVEVVEGEITDEEIIEDVVEEEVVSSFCEDNDYGIFMTIASTCTDNEAEYKDVCVDDKSVKEYVCSTPSEEDTVCLFVEADCEAGFVCKDGACVQSESCEDYPSQECKEVCGSSDLNGVGGCSGGDVCCLELPPLPYTNV